MTDNRWSARREAAQALREILYDRGYSSIVLNRRLRNLPPEADRKDRAFIASLVYTTISELYYIDAVINTYSKTAVVKMKPWVAVVLRMTVQKVLRWWQPMVVISVIMKALTALQNRSCR